MAQILTFWEKGNRKSMAVLPLKNTLPNSKKTFMNMDLEYYQSNIEGELIDKIQEVGFSYDGIILNAGAYTHTSIGIGDAIKGVTTPVVEVHISNTFNREDFRHVSHISPAAKGVILGFGLQSYNLAIQSFLN